MNFKVYIQAMKDRKAAEEELKQRENKENKEEKAPKKDKEMTK